MEIELKWSPLEALDAGQEAWAEYCQKYEEHEKRRDQNLKQCYSVTSSFLRSYLVSFEGLDLSGRNLSGYNFTKANLDGAITNATDFQDAKFEYPPYLIFNENTPPNLRDALLDFNAVFNRYNNYGPDPKLFSYSFLKQFRDDNVDRESIGDSIVLAITSAMERCVKRGAISHCENFVCILNENGLYAVQDREKPSKIIINALPTTENPLDPLAPECISGGYAKILLRYVVKELTKIGADPTMSSSGVIVDGGDLVMFGGVVGKLDRSVQFRKDVKNFKRMDFAYE